MGYVGKVAAGGSTHLVGSTLYGTCSTAAATAAKAVTCADFDTLVTGVTIHVLFSKGNTAARPSLNVNSTGAKQIRQSTEQELSGSYLSLYNLWNAGEVVSFTYSGEYWMMNDRYREPGGVFNALKVGDTTVGISNAYSQTLVMNAGSNVTLEAGSGAEVTISATDTTYDPATTTSDGLMSAADKAKLDGVDAGANAYTHPAYDAAAAAAVKVGRDATGHVVLGGALAASDVGASATGHKHAAGDITSGTLGVARGGTGASTLGAGVVYHSASGTGALSIATAANIVSAIGITAVNRATADANGNDIASTYALKSELAGLYRYKGSVASESALPSTGQETGDVYNIEAASSYGGAGMNVAWNGTAWDALGEMFSITALTNAEIDAICV